MKGGKQCQDHSYACNALIIHVL